MFKIYGSIALYLAIGLKGKKETFRKYGQVGRIHQRTFRRAIGENQK